MRPSIKVVKQANIKIWSLFRYKQRVMRILKYRNNNHSTQQIKYYFQIDEERGEYIIFNPIKDSNRNERSISKRIQI